LFSLSAGSLWGALPEKGCVQMKCKCNANIPAAPTLSFLERILLVTQGKLATNWAFQVAARGKAGRSLRQAERARYGADPDSFPCHSSVPWAQAHALHCV
jgi:hypothetical protein